MEKGKCPITGVSLNINDIIEEPSIKENMIKYNEKFINENFEKKGIFSSCNLF